MEGACLFSRVTACRKLAVGAEAATEELVQGARVPGWQGREEGSIQNVGIGDFPQGEARESLEADVCARCSIERGGRGVKKET